ncbi:MAG: ABC transporter permease [Oscillospiraceae bacterium]|nr:ABC transporter permease [Oscillospiraceae bacterium]
MNGAFSYIFSVTFLQAIIRMSTPIIFAGMAALIGAKADIFCVAYEGMMLFAALGGVLGGAYSGSLLVGMLVGIAASLCVAGVFAYFVLVLRTQPMLIGLALNILGTGGTAFILYVFTGQRATSLNLSSYSFPVVRLPFLEGVPVLGELLSGMNLLTWLAYLSVILVYVLLYKTPLGLKIRAVGESANAAESLGINPTRMKVIAIMISGVLAAFGGMFMSMGYSNYFNKNMVAGRGFTGIAAQDLGAGRPGLTLLCAILFGLADAIGIAMQSFRLPPQIADVTPYIMTIIGLVVIGKLEAKRERKHALELGAQEAARKLAEAQAEAAATETE